MLSGSELNRVMGMVMLIDNTWTNSFCYGQWTATNGADAWTLS